MTPSRNNSHTTKMSHIRAARMLAIPFGEYTEWVKAGFKWCSVCKDWKTRDEFHRNRSRADGLQSHCTSCNTRHSKRN